MKNLTFSITAILLTLTLVGCNSTSTTPTAGVQSTNQVATEQAKVVEQDVSAMLSDIDNLMSEIDGASDFEDFNI